MGGRSGRAGRESSPGKEQHKKPNDAREKTQKRRNLINQQTVFLQVDLHCLERKGKRKVEFSPFALTGLRFIQVKRGEGEKEAASFERMTGQFRLFATKD